MSDFWRKLKYINSNPFQSYENINCKQFLSIKPTCLNADEFKCQLVSDKVKHLLTNWCQTITFGLLYYLTKSTICFIIFQFDVLAHEND